MRSSIFALAVLAACGNPAPTPPPHNVATGVHSPPDGPSIEALRAAVELCSRNKLPTQSAFDIDVIARPTKLRLRVTYAPMSPIAGKAFALDLLPHFDVDDGTQTCDGVAIRVPVIAGTNFEHLIDLAQICARGEPWHGKGASSPLDWEHPTVHVLDTRITVEYPEKTPTTKPSGVELAVDLATGTCAAVPRD